jgi:hypothetical protein
MCRRLARKLSIDRRIDVALCDDRILETPISLGIHRPRIMLPLSFVECWNVEKIQIAILHELAHIRRWDLLVNLFQQLVQIPLGLNPGARLVSKQASLEREYCCDHLVLSLTGNARTYAETLISMAKTPKVPRTVIPLGGNDVIKRIARIFRSTRPGGGYILAPGTLVLAGLLTVIALPIASVLCQIVKLTVGAPVDPRFGQSNEIGQKADFGYDSARDISRVVTALKDPSSMAGMKFAFGQRDGGESAMNVAKGLGIGFGASTAVHLMGTFAINNFGGLGRGL